MPTPWSEQHVASTTKSLCQSYQKQGLPSRSLPEQGFCSLTYRTAYEKVWGGDTTLCEDGGGLHRWRGAWSISCTRKGWETWGRSVWRREGWKGISALFIKISSVGVKSMGADSCVTRCREPALAGGWTQWTPEVPSILWFCLLKTSHFVR